MLEHGTLNNWYCELVFDHAAWAEYFKPGRSDFVQKSLKFLGILGYSQQMHIETVCLTYQLLIGNILMLLDNLCSKPQQLSTYALTLFKYHTNIAGQDVVVGM